MDEKLKQFKLDTIEIFKVTKKWKPNLLKNNL